MLGKLKKGYKWIIGILLIFILSGYFFTTIIFKEPSVESQNYSEQVKENSDTSKVDISISTNDTINKIETKEEPENNQLDENPIKEKNADINKDNKKDVVKENTSSVSSNSITKNQPETENKTEVVKEQPKTENKEESVKEQPKKETSQDNPKPVVKTQCSNSNKEWLNYINTYKKSNPSSVIFYNLSNAKNYGEYAMNNFGYGYWYNPVAEKYSNNECEIEFYAVQLYIPNNECLDKNGKGNSKIYIPATQRESLIDNISYLVNHGFDCSGKCTIDGSKCY